MDRHRATATTRDRGSPRKLARTTSAHTPSKLSSIPQSPAIKPETEEMVGGDIMVKVEPGKAPKLSRSSSKKIPARAMQKFFDLPDASSDACRSFEKLKACTYANKYMGLTDAAYDCDCAEEWGKTHVVIYARLKAC